MDLIDRNLIGDLVDSHGNVHYEDIMNLPSEKIIANDGDMYIIFGNVPRSDGSNIYGVYKTLSAAKEELELAKLRKPWEEYHIEEFGVWG